MQLKTERLLIRDITIDDRYEIFSYRSDKETNIFQSWVPETMQDVEHFIERNMKAFNLPETWYQLLITDRQTKEVIGDIGIHFFGNENVQAELGITIAKHFHGKGYASESLRAVIDYLFQNLQKHRIIASVDPLNTSSVKLMERLGFRKEGHFIKSLFWKNEWVDDIIYAVLKEEWHAQP